jgi:hypothetical protein
MRILPEDHKERRSEICIAFTRHSENKGEGFLVMGPGFTTGS